jgi:hypothetical protein
MPKDGTNYKQLCNLTTNGAGDFSGTWRGSALRIRRRNGEWGGWMMGRPSTPGIPVTSEPTDSIDEVLSRLIDMVEQDRQQWFDIAASCEMRVQMRDDLPGILWTTRGKTLQIPSSFDQTETAVLNTLKTAVTTLLT